MIRPREHASDDQLLPWLALAELIFARGTARFSAYSGPGVLWSDDLVAPRGTGTKRSLLKLLHPNEMLH
jgi:hypothetical protein